MRREQLSHRARSRLAATGFVATLFGGATPAVAGDWYVDAQAPNCVNADGSASSPFCSIGEAVVAASSSDVIHVAPGTYFECVMLDKSLKLIGDAGASVTTVDGGRLGSVFLVTAAAWVELEGLTITNGKARYGGGVNLDVGGSVTLTKCILVNNQADAVDATGAPLESRGGGVFASHATVAVAATTFSDNFANSSGGAILSDYGSLTVTDSTFTRNVSGDSAGFAGGGGAINGSGDGSMVLTRSTFEANRSDNPNQYDGGGAIFSAVDLVADEIVVRANAGFSGGGIDAQHPMTLRDSTIEDNTAVWFGGGLSAGGSTIERCSIRGNLATGWQLDSGRGGGVAAGNSTITDCLIENNMTDSAYGTTADGGGLEIDGCQVVRCVIRGNVTAGIWGDGGGIFTSGLFTITDSAIIGNSATSRDPSSAGFGGGIFILERPFDSGTITRCTIAGNSAAGGVAPGFGGDGGGLMISHVLVAGNTCAMTGGAPDCSGPISSLGYNLIGDTTGCTITGDGTGNQLDVDPLFADPGNGDFTLRSDSPALDAGDPAVRVAGADAAGSPRVLDGDLDRKMVVDLGAYEFDNVHLEVTGQATPGGTLTFTTTGTAGLPILMLVGSVPGELLAPPFGTLFLDFTDPWLMVAWGSVPDQRSWSVDPSIPVPSEWILQPLVLDAATHAGNLGNAVVLALE
jgi:predicted outer membrane repeat protein